MSYVRVNGPRRGYEVGIDLEWCRRRMDETTHCELTGWRLALGPREPGRDNPFAPSFDRIDNDVGYVPGNIRVVCQFVNFLMAAYSDEKMEYVLEALRVAAHD